MSTAYYDVHKKAVYEACGVREYWVVNPKEKSVEIYVDSEKGFQSIAKAVARGEIHSRTAVSFGVNLGDLFVRV